MRKINLCLSAITLLWMVACKKKDTTVTPAAPGKVSFTAERFGPGELKGMENQAYVHITGSTPNATFTYELSGAEGFSNYDSTVNYVGAGALDNNGNGFITYETTSGRVNPFARFNDGEITLKIKFPKNELTATTIKEQYVIRDAADFLNMDVLEGPYLIKGHYVQEADFAFDLPFPGAPMRHTFYGTYDGKGHTIRNLQINYTEKLFLRNSALFTAIDKATIKNLKLELSGNGIVNKFDDLSCGGLVGSSSNSKIINCSVTGNVSGGDAGGIVGLSSYDTLIGVAFRGTVTSASGHCGGLGGYISNGLVKMSYASFKTDFTNGGGALYGKGYQTAVSDCYTFVENPATDNIIYPITTFATEDGFVNINRAYSNLSLTTVPDNRVTVFPDRATINAALAEMVVNEWPADVTAPANKKPFVASGTANAHMKLWWE